MKPHIVYFHPHFTLPGGAGNYVLQTASLLVQRGYKVSIVCIRADRELLKACHRDVQFVEIGGALSSSFLHWLLFPLFIVRLVRTVKGLKPDILFPQVFPANWWGFIDCSVDRTKSCIWMCQEPSAFIHSKPWIAALPAGIMKGCVLLFQPLLKWIDIRLVRNADVILANSEYTRRYAERVYPGNSERMSVTPLGVDHRLFKPSSDGARFQRRQVITIGRLTAFKNIDVILYALAELKVRGSEPVSLVIVGSGEEERTLQELSEKLRLQSWVRFVGSVSNASLVLHLQQSCACILASVDEPFGLVVVEAMACGTPAIVVNQGGPAETVEDGQNGFYVAAKDYQDLAGKLEELLRDEDRFAAMCKAAVLRASRYSWENSVNDLEQHFQRMLLGDES